MYGEFAAVYDGFMEEVPYEAWCDYLDQMIKEHNAPRGTLMDLACGTGSITMGMARRGYHAVGGDISPQMLDLAVRRSRAAGLSIPFYAMDMTEFSVVNPVSVITAMCDGVNYLSGDSLADFFASAYDALLPGGLLLFDLSTRYRMEQVLGENTYADENEDSAYILVTHPEPDGCLMELTLFIKEGERYRREYEEHKLYAHETEDVADQLYDAGFDSVEVFPFLGKGELTGREERILILARR